MKFHVVRSRSFFGDMGGIADAGHASLFHGTANRGGRKPTSENAQMAWAIDRPLCLHKNVYKIADLFSPAFGTLVVSASVRAAFHDLPGVQFSNVKFATLFEFPFREGDFSHYKTIGNYLEFEQFIDRQVNDPVLHKTIGEYCELNSPPVREFREKYQLQEIEVRFGARESDSSKLLVGRELLSDVSIYSHGGHVMTEQVYERLEPFINWTYFLYGAGEI